MQQPAFSGAAVMAGVPAGPSRRAPGPGIVAVACVGLLYLVVILVQLRGASRRGDFSIYYACAVAMRRGLDPYAINLTQFTRELGFEPDVFTHPADTPAFTQLTVPLAMAPAPVAYAIWVASSTLCLFASLFLLFGPASGLNRKAMVGFSVCALGFSPVADNYRWAQSEIFVLFGVVVFLRLMGRGRDRAASSILAALGLLRGFPLALGGYLIAQRRWIAIWYLAIAFTIGAALTIAAVGIGRVENFFRIVAGLGGYQWLALDYRWSIAPANVSLDAFVTRPLVVAFGAPSAWLGSAQPRAGPRIQGRYSCSNAGCDIRKT